MQYQPHGFGTTCYHAPLFRVVFGHEHSSRVQISVGDYQSQSTLSPLTMARLYIEPSFPEGQPAGDPVVSDPDVALGTPPSPSHRSWTMPHWS